MKDYDKIELKDFVNNQKCSISYNNETLITLLQQNRSTPGVRTNVYFPYCGIYIITVNISISEMQIFFWIAPNKKIYLSNGDNIFKIEIDKIGSYDIGFLITGPILNSTFSIKDFNIKYKNKSYVEDNASVNLEAGISFLIRAKNEEQNIMNCIESLERVCTINDEIIFVDNNSSDNTLTIAKTLEKRYENLFVYQYNIDIAKPCENYFKCLTKENSIAKYYNWCLSKVTKHNIIKWDCDFIALENNLRKMIDKFSLRTRNDKFALWFTGKTLYYGKYINPIDYYDEYRAFSKLHGFKWEDFKSCESGTNYVKSCENIYRYEIPVFYEIKTKRNIKEEVLNERDSKDNEILNSIDDTFNGKNIIMNYKVLILIPSLSLGGGNYWVINIYNQLISFGMDIKIYCKNQSNGVYNKYIEQNDIINNITNIEYYINANHFTHIISGINSLKLDHLNSIKKFIVTHSDISNINKYIIENINHIDKIIVVNEITAQKFLKKNITKTHFIPNYLDQKFDFEQNKKRTFKCGCITRLSPEKNILMLIHSFKNIEKNYKLYIVGDGNENYKKAIKDCINELELNGCVFMIGYQENVEQYYRDFDFVILPSVSEGCAYNILESILFSTPIIVTDIHANREIIDDLYPVIKFKGLNKLTQNDIYVDSYKKLCEYIGYRNYYEVSMDDTWNKNVKNIINTLNDMINNYDKWANIREKIYNKIKQKYINKKYFMTKLLELFDIHELFVL